MKVADMMTRSVAAVGTETPLKDVAALMVEKGISGVPVVGADGSVLGVVSEADFVIKERGADGVRRRLLARVFGESRQAKRELAKIKATTAGEAMTSPAVTVGASDSMRRAAELMAGRKINRLPVVDRGRLVGIVTRADVVRAFVRPDAELERLVRQEVLARTAFWLEPDQFHVAVRAGVVHLAGRVDRRSLAETIVEVTHALGGVVAVQSSLSWEIDDVSSTRGPATPDPVLPLRRR
jgi:CBS domain-containing protein